MFLSNFGRILREVVETTPGATGAVFSDWEGEPVDQFSNGQVLDIQILGAQWGLVLQEAMPALRRARAGAAHSLHIECQEMQVFIRAITDRYYVVLSARGDANLGKAISALDKAANQLAREM